MRKSNVIQIDKKGLIFNNFGLLKYFYDLKPKSVQSWTPPWSSKSINNSINSDGLNERYDYSGRKDQNIYRIITLGDSFTFGQYVKTNENYPEQLEDLLIKNCKSKKFEVINLGVYGYDIQYAVKRLETKGLKYDPDLVLWFLKDDDFQEIQEINFPKLQYHRNRLKADESYYKIQKEGIYTRNFEIVDKELLETYGEENILQMQKSFLQNMSRIYHGQLIFITFHSSQKKYKDIMSDYINENKNTLLYDKVINVFEKGKTFPDGHPNPEGYRLIAQNLYEYLLLNKIVSCN